MWNVCPACGMYSVEKQVRPARGARAEALCPQCGHAHPFLRLPLFAISGASGTGKSAAALAMAGRDQTCVHLESDILWRAEFNQPEDDYRGYREMWLRLCKNIAQGGRPVALYGSVVPDQLEACAERRYLGPVHTLALVCAPDVLADRLRSRPAWRGTSSAEFIAAMLAFNEWFLNNAALADPPITLLDTSQATLDETCGAISAWIAARLAGDGEA